MENCAHLVWYGFTVILLAGGLVIVPYWRGRAELLSAWNLLLFGVAIFIGVGCIEAAWSPMRFAGVEWFHPTKSGVNSYLASTTVFLVVLFGAYYYDPLSRGIARRVFNRWPPISTEVLVFALVVCLLIALAARVPALAQLTFVGNVLKNASHKAMVTSCAFSFLLWYRNRINLLWLGVFVVVILSMCLLAMVISPGRRLLLSMVLGPVIMFYFYQARLWRPSRGIIAIGIAMMAVFVISLMYSMIRHVDRRTEKGVQYERTVALMFKAVTSINSTSWLKNFSNDVLWGISQHVVHYGMLTEHYVQNDQLKAKPLNTFKFLLAYPIPRRVWRDKPESLGRTITHQMLGRTTTWGTGIAGHCAYEGGLIVAAMFAYFAVFWVRLFDEPLRRQPSNPFLIAMLTTAAMHIIAWPRGDLAVMTFEVTECLLFTLALGFSCRMLFGTDRNWVGAYPAIRGRRDAYRSPVH